MQVLAELYGSQDLPIKPHIVVALVLHKILDQARHQQRAAVHRTPATCHRKRLAPSARCGNGDTPKRRFSDLCRTVTRCHLPGCERVKRCDSSLISCAAGRSLQAQDVREDALQMLDVLSQRHWQQEQRSSMIAGSAQAASGGSCDTVIGSLPESWLQHQLRLSTKLARCVIIVYPPSPTSPRQQHVYKRRLCTNARPVLEQLCRAIACGHSFLR